MAPSEQLPFFVKRDIVQRLAEFQGLTEIAKAIKDSHGIEIKPQRVQYYDPTKTAGKALAEDLKTLFFEARKKALEDLDGIRIFHKASQLRALDRMLALAESRGQIAMVIPLIEAAAKIAGTITAKVDVKHSGTVTVDDGARQRVFDRLDDLRKRIAGRVDGLAAAAGASRTPEGVG